jgi:hypothetical protein
MLITIIAQRRMFDSMLGNYHHQAGSDAVVSIAPPQSSDKLALHSITDKSSVGHD